MQFHASSLPRPTRTAFIAFRHQRHQPAPRTLPRMPLQARVRPSISSLQPQQLQIHISAARPRFIDRCALFRPGSQRRVRLFQQSFILAANRRFEPRCNTRQFRPHKCAPHASVKSTPAAIPLTPLFPETCLIPVRTPPQVPVPTKSPPAPFLRTLGAPISASGSVSLRPIDPSSFRPEQADAFSSTLLLLAPGFIWGEVVGLRREKSLFDSSSLYHSTPLDTHTHSINDPDRSSMPSLPTPAFDDPKHHLRIYQGDCLDILAQIPESSVDLIFADPPYFLLALSACEGSASPVTPAKWSPSIKAISTPLVSTE